jgi:hypothetical protein
MLAIWLERLWEARRVREPETYPSIQVAIFKLREATGMTHQELGFRLGFSRIQHVEVAGKGHNQQLLSRLARLARVYSLPRLEEYFRFQMGRMQFKLDKKDYSDAYPGGFANREKEG